MCFLLVLVSFLQFHFVGEYEDKWIDIEYPEKSKGGKGRKEIFFCIITVEHFNCLTELVGFQYRK